MVMYKNQVGLSNTTSETQIPVCYSKVTKLDYKINPAGNVYKPITGYIIPQRNVQIDCFNLFVGLRLHSLVKIENMRRVEEDFLYTASMDIFM